MSLVVKAGFVQVRAGAGAAGEVLGWAGALEERGVALVLDGGGVALRLVLGGSLDVPAAAAGDGTGSCGDPTSADCAPPLHPPATTTIKGSSSSADHILRFIPRFLFRIT
ncbi:MAG TPA: hypothetical protein VHC18_05025 [Amycolatopsis sp.]|nr:hypothetical protein [Amycolatopsis sp.]